MTVLPALALASLLQSSAAATTGPLILRCDMGAGRTGGAGTETWRTFRLGPKVFQEWNAKDRKFGPNLCQSFACSADESGLRGSITSATLILTVELGPDRQHASWKTVGASGLSRSSGPCRIQVEKPSPSR